MLAGVLERRELASRLCDVSSAVRLWLEREGLERRDCGLSAGDFSGGLGEKLSVGGTGLESVGWGRLVSAGSETGGLLEMESLASKGAGSVESAGLAGELKLSAGWVGLAGCRRVGGEKVSVGVGFGSVLVGWERSSTGGSVRLSGLVLEPSGVLRRSWNWGSDLGLRDPEVGWLAGVAQFPEEQLSQGLQQAVGQQELKEGATGYHGV